MNQISHPTLDQLISPFSAAKFWEDIFEQKAQYFPQAAVDLDFTLEYFEKLLWSHETNLHESVQVNKNGKDVYYNKTAAGKDQFRWLMDQYQAGCTIIFNGIDKIVPKVAHFAQSLDDLFFGQTSVNAFLTPPNSRGFLPHFDTHDVFILQTSGDKEWALWDKKLELPLDRQIYLIDQEKQGNPKAEIKLEKGNVLYIPRGIVHGAQTNKTHSLHLTIGVRPLLGLDYLSTFLDVISENDSELRRGILSEDLMASGDLAKRMIKILDKNADNNYYKKLVFERLHIEKAGRLRPLPGHHLKNINSLDELKINTPVEKASGINAALADHKDKIRLVFPGLGFSGKKDIQHGYIEFPAVAFGALRFIIEKEGAFTAAEINDFYPDETKLLIVKKLVEEGFLKITWLDQS